MRRWVFLWLLILPSGLAAKSKTGKESAPIARGPAWGEGLPVLTFEQAARLEYWNRVRYVRLLRQTMVEYETIQKGLLRSWPGYAQLDQPDRDLWALLLFPKATAETEEEPKQHDRQRTVLMEQCLYCFNLMDWKGKWTPGAGCTTPPRCSGGGVQCGFIGSGLTGENACVPRLNTFEYTKAAYERMQSLSGSSEVSQTIEEFRTFISGNPSVEEISAAGWPRRLVGIAYSEEAFANLIWLVQRYRENGAELPGDTFDGAELGADGGFQGAFEKLSRNIDQVFLEVEQHCRRRLTPDAIEEIKAGKHPAMKGLTVREKRRQNDLETVLARGDHATVENVLQPDECRIFRERRDRIRDEYNNIRFTLDEPPPVQDEQIDTSRQSIGCPNWDGDAGQNGTRCAACTIQKVTENAEGGPFDMSTRWMNLIETMARVCHFGRDGLQQQLVPPGVMQKYFEVFGYCGKSSYSWDEVDPEIQQEAYKFAQRGFYTGARTKKGMTKISEQPDAKVDRTGWWIFGRNVGLFEKAYGISFKDAQELFCGRQVFTAAQMGGEGPARGLASTPQGPGSFFDGNSDLYGHILGDDCRFNPRAPGCPGAESSGARPSGTRAGSGGSAGSVGGAPPPGRGGIGQRNEYQRRAQRLVKRNTSLRQCIDEGIARADRLFYSGCLSPTPARASIGDRRFYQLVNRARQGAGVWIAPPGATHICSVADFYTEAANETPGAPKRQIITFRTRPVEGPAETAEADVGNGSFRSAHYGRQREFIVTPPRARSCPGEGGGLSRPAGGGRFDSGRQ